MRTLEPPPGLSEAEAARRLHAEGPNRVAAHEPGILEELLESLREPLVLLLLAVGAVYAVVGDVRDALVILGVIVSVALAETWTEWRAGRAVAALSRLAAPQAHVRRDGVLRVVPSQEVVTGDVVELAAGARVPADARLDQADALAVDESLLTGEAEPVDHDVTTSPDVLAGTLVVRGRGVATVTATGASSTLGRIARLVEETPEPRTPLQRQMSGLARILLLVALTLSIAVPVVGVVAGQPLRDMVLTGLTLAFATIPEELPVQIVVVLGIGSYDLARRGAVVRRLVAAETLGATTVLCIDKTGTLTQNRLSVVEVVPAATVVSGAEPSDAARGTVLEAARRTAARPGSAASVDPVDAAVWAADGAAPDPGGGDPVAGVVRRYPFDVTRRTAGAAVAAGDGVEVSVSGAPEAVLSRCARWRAGTAERPLGPTERGALLEAARLAGRRGRVLAVATRRLAAVPDGRDEAESDLVVEGLLVLADPLRPGVADVVAELRTAGLSVAMVTGDQETTAAAVAEAAGLAPPAVVRGDAVAGWDDGEVARAAAAGTVFCRVRPEEKLRIVRALRGAGEVVAVTGDGVNDAPALRAAAIGVAMGRGGSDVAREAADLVLTDDDLATIARAVAGGRRLYDNLRKGVRFYLAVKVALVMVSLGAAVAGSALPFAPVQIVVLELFMDLGASTAFISQAEEGDVMRRPPRDPAALFLDRPMAGVVLGAAAVLAALTGGAFALGIHLHDVDGARTLALVAWLVGHATLGVTVSSMRRPSGLGPLLRNRPLLAWFAASWVFAALVATVGPLARALHAGPVGLADGLLVGAAAAAVPLLVAGVVAAVRRPA